jgi:hypothetical protein
MGILLVGFVCVVGIVLENARWPQDRSEQRARLVEADSAAESVWVLVGLVLGHSVVRWVLGLGFGSVVVLTILQAPPVLAAVKAMKDEHRIPVSAIELATGAAISALMVAIALAARRLAR